MKQIPILKITQVGFHWEWFQLFILGFYELERAGKIKLKFRCELIYRLSTIFPENYFIGGALRLINKKLSSRSPILKGEIIINGGGVKNFVLIVVTLPLCLIQNA